MILTDIVPWGEDYALIDTRQPFDSLNYETIIVKCSRKGNVRKKAWETPFAILRNILPEDAKRVHYNCVRVLADKEGDNVNKADEKAS